MIHGSSVGGFLLNANTTTFVSRRPVSASDHQSRQTSYTRQPNQTASFSAGIPKLLTSSHLACSSCDGTCTSEMETSKKRKKKKWDYKDGAGEMKSEQHKAMMSASDQSSSSSDSEDESEMKRKKKKMKMGPAEETHEYHTASKDEKKKNRCWEGYEPVEGKAPFSPNSCRKKKD